MRVTLSIICVLLAACLSDEGRDRTGDDLSNASSDDVVALLAGVGRTEIDGAVRRLKAFDYTLDRSVKVTDESGSVVVQESHVTTFSGPPDDRTVVVTDSTSTGGDAGFWTDYVPEPVSEDTLNWSTRLLDDDPLVLTPQGRGYYRYTQLEDTTIGSYTVSRIRVDMMSGSDRTGIQSGVFYVETSDKELVGFVIDFAQRSLLFDEESTFRYLLQEGPDGTWLPARVDVSTYLNLPLSKGQIFELHARYVDPT